MSDLTICNFCILENMKLRAKERNVGLLMTTDKWGWIEVRYSDREEPSVWLMKVTDHCVC